MIAAHLMAAWVSTLAITISTDCLTFGLPTLRWNHSRYIETMATHCSYTSVKRPGITALNGLFVGFGTLFTDLDADGDEDLVVTNGHVINYPRNAPIQQLPLVLLNNNGKRFVRLNLTDSYFSTPHIGRGLAVGDLDQDGDPDLVFANNHEPAALLRNDSPENRQWLRVRLIGRQSNRDAIGSVLLLRTSQGDMMRMVKGGTSYLSHSDIRSYWGIPKGAKTYSLEVRWPSGEIKQIDNPALGQTISVVEETRPD